jgi:CBS domain containing-hemolysin-like protein
MRQLFRQSIKWSLGIAVITFVLAAIFSIISTYMMNGVTWATGMAIVLVIVFIGIGFDMLGIASTAADEAPFHAMASEKVPGAKQAIRIIRNADRFASFCNDVIGDISGIISGTASAIVIIQFTLALHYKEDSPIHFIISVIFTSLVAALTVGGKAVGKSIAIRFSTDIILIVGRLFYMLENRFNIVILKDKKKKTKKQRNKKRK